MATAADKLTVQVNPVYVQGNTWGDKVSRYAKAITGGITALLGIVTPLIAILGDVSIPAQVYAWISGAIAVLTAFNVWLTANTPKVADIADSTEDLVEDVLHRDV